MAPLVRTGGSRHTGLAAPPHHNIQIELTRQADNVYRLDHAVTKTQKNILNAFGLTDKNIEYRANWISEELKKSMMKEKHKNGER